MIEFVTLSCPTCGAKLEVSKEINRFACGHCGNEHIVIRSGGMVSLNPVGEDLKQIQKGTDQTAAELAIRRLTNEISSLKKELSDFIYKGYGVDKLPLFGTPTHYFGSHFYRCSVEASKPGILESIKMYDAGFPEIEKAIYNLSIEEVEEILREIVPKQPERLTAGITEFGNSVIEYKKRLNKKKQELERNHKIVSND
jgi:hypothetical protein